MTKHFNINNLYIYLIRSSQAISIFILYVIYIYYYGNIVYAEDITKQLLEERANKTIEQAERDADRAWLALGVYILFVITISFIIDKVDPPPSPPPSP